MLIDDEVMIERSCAQKEALHSHGVMRRFFTLDLWRGDSDDLTHVNVQAFGLSVVEAIDLFFMSVAGFEADEVAFALEGAYVQGDNPDTGRNWTDDELSAFDVNGPDGARLVQALTMFMAQRGVEAVRHYMRPYHVDDETHALVWHDVMIGDEVDSEHDLARLMSAAFEHDKRTQVVPRLGEYSLTKCDELVMSALAEMGYVVSLVNREGISVASRIPFEAIPFEEI